MKIGRVVTWNLSQTGAVSYRISYQSRDVLFKKFVAQLSRLFSCSIRYSRKPLANNERKCFSKHSGPLEEVFLTVMLRHSLIKSIVSMQLGCLCVYGNGRFDNEYVIQNPFSLPNVNAVQLNGWWEEINSSNCGYCLDVGPNIQRIRMTDTLYLIRLGQKHFFPNPNVYFFISAGWLRVLLYSLLVNCVTHFVFIILRV